MKKIDSEACKIAIVEYIRAHPGCVFEQFVMEDMPDPLDAARFEAPALEKKNWKRESKEKFRDFWVRGYDCRPYDSQLRAYVRATDTEIQNIEIVGE